MAYQALYRKYRPLTFSDVIGQEHITETLKSELASGKNVHAYLFTGTRGTGKTSCAKILARSVNCQKPQNGDPCLECESCLLVASGENTDIVEIDAASNNSVDSIRELREMINFAPSSSKYRVYIIDEVHMLSISAFNALLKTLEEPPAHVIFILATTEVHKLPATILSRCQRFDFRRIESDKICERLQYICKQEGISLTDDAASLIASAADGGMRDALSILDLCASVSRNITEAVVESVCAMAGSDYCLELADLINAGDTENALLLIDKLYSSSVDMQRLLSELSNHYRDLLIVKTVKVKKKPIVCSVKKLELLEQQASSYELSEIMYCLSILQASFAQMASGNRRNEMEMAVLKMCNPRLTDDISSLERRVAILEKRIEAGLKAAETTKIKGIGEQPINQITEEEIPLPEEPIEDNAEENAQNTVNSPKNNEDTPIDEWKQILKLLSSECPLIAGVLKGSRAYIKGGYLLIDAQNSQFRSLINSGNPIYKDSIRKAALTVLGETYKLGPYTKPKTSDASDPLVDLAEKLKNFEV